MLSPNPSQTERRRAAASFHFLPWIALAVIVLGIQVQAAQAQFRELLSRLPGGANAVVLLNVEKAMDSPFGVAQGWRENAQKAFDAGLVRFPPQTTQFALAAQMDLEFMEPIWEAGVVNVSEMIPLETIAEKRSGTLDSIENLPTLVLPNDTYVVQFGPKTLGGMAPANRQAVVRWIRELRTRSDAALSPYLQRAAGYSDDAGTEVIIAIDLEGVFYQGSVHDYLKSKELLDESNVDREALAKLLAGVQGVRIGIRIGEKPFGKIVVDFADDVSMTAPFAKPLLLEILADVGATIGALAEWKPAVQGTTISLEGYLSPDGMRRVMSVVESSAPAGTAARQTKEAVSPGDSAAMKAQKSLEHFRAVTGMFDDLKKDMKNLKTLSSAQLWFDKYAKRIERLPILNVDEELLDYSAYVAQSLRAATGAVKTMGIRGGARQAQVTSGDGTVGYAYGGGYRYGRYGGYGGHSAYSPRMEARNVGSERRVVRSQERAGMAANVQTIRADVIAATTDMRRKMTQRYQIEF